MHVSKYEAEFQSFKSWGSERESAFGRGTRVMTGLLTIMIGCHIPSYTYMYGGNAEGLLPDYAGVSPSPSEFSRAGHLGF